MKVIIPVAGDKLTSKIAENFGVAKNFLLADSETEKSEVLKNPGTGDVAGFGLSAAQLVIERGIKAVIAEKVGPRAFELLRREGVVVYSIEPGLTGKKALDLFNKDKLEEMQTSEDELDVLGRGVGPGKRQGRRPRGFGKPGVGFRRVSM